MQIACPSCKARINVPDDKIKPTGTKVKCGKCEKIFTVKKKASQGGDTAPKTADPAAKKASPDSSPKVSEPAAVPESAGGFDELEDLFGGPPGAADPAPAAKDPDTSLEDELGLGQSSAPAAEDSLLDGDGFGAEMDNYKTQLRPMGGAREEDLFGSSSDLDTASRSPARDDNTASLFGSSDDLGGGDLGAPEGDLGGDFGGPAGGDSPPDFDADGGLFSDAPAPSKGGFDAKPAKDDLDDLFGKGLEDDPSDELVNKLLESKPKKESKPEARPARPAAENADGLDDLFASDQAQRESPADAPSSDKLDALFEDDTGSSLKSAAKQKPKPGKPAQAKPKAEPQSLDLAGGSSADELALSMQLEPALKEEDIPLPAAAKPEKKAAAVKKKAPTKAIVLVFLLVALIGGGAATVFVPAVNKPVMAAIDKIPFAALFAMILPAEDVPEVEVIRVGVSVRGGRLLTGAQGDKLYVLEGTVRNDYPEARSFIKVRGVLRDADGLVISEREVYAGNVLNDDEIRGLDRVRIDGTLNRSVGGGLQNFNVPPGSTIPFQIVFYDVEQPVSDHTVQATGAERGS